ncbi:MAG: DUF4965 domain-containing protein [Firmicutes bacterium]|nr:DUF4965 domain-containing protein [Bacillota bacterium]
MALLQEALVGRLGSRFSLNFRPRELKVYLSPMGRFYDQPVEMGIGLRLNGKSHILPFANIEGIETFSKVEQEFLVDGVEYKVRDVELGLEFVCRVHAPFYPENRKISTAPFFYIDLAICSFIHGRSKFKPVNGEWIFFLSGAEIRTDKSLTLPITSRLAKDCWYYTNERPPESRSLFSESSFNGEIKVCPLFLNSTWQTTHEITNVCLSKRFNLESPKQVLRETLIIAGFQQDTVLKVWQNDCRFLYTEYFANIDEVIEYARSERDELLEKTALFCDTIYHSSISKAAKSLIACGFQNYLANSWWVRDQNDADWFFVWEGWCGFHSTLDVEYNSSWFALLFWPELLAKQMDYWFQSIQPEGFPSHDIGILLEVNSQVYPHHMPVEESCNLLLLTYVLWRFRGYRKWLRHLPELVKVVKYLLTTDTTGNGYPNIGVANTIDDAAASVQFAKEQTYLAVKVLSALTAFLELTGNIPDCDILKELAAKSNRMIDKIKDTMESQAWLEDHYAVCLPQSTEDLKDVWTGKKIEGEDLNGWDAYSLYTTNGLLFLLATGIKPDLNYERLLIDLQQSMNKSITPFGCTHSSIDRSNVWISQNFWRDQIACYLGIDLLDMAERYWKYLEWENTQGRGGCFVDTYGWNWLSYYPRGITSFGILASALGMRVNAETMTIDLSPVRLPCRFPLTIIADWEKGSIPWIECRVEHGKIRWLLEDQSPNKWRININFDSVNLLKN